MPVVGDASIVVDADTAPFDKNLKSGVEKSASGAGTIIKGILGAAVVTQGAQIGVGLFKDAISEGRESQKVMALTQAVIKSTGDASGVTAKQFGDLANKLSLVSGTDDELIQASENVLATFTNIRNAQGKNNDIFNQAETAALDLSKALGTDLQGATIQIGKALNDPIKGVTALQRVGVSFTASQKDQIKTLVESGKSMDAQKLILGELNKEFGGAAAASTNAGQRLGVTFKNIEETIGLKLLPIIDKAASFLADKLPGAIDATGKAFGKIRTALQPTIDNLTAFFKTLTTGFTEDEGTPIENLALKFRDFYEKALKPLAAFIQDNLKPILIGIGAALLLTAGPLVALGAAFVIAYAKSQTFRDIVGGVIAEVTKIIAGLVLFVQTNLPAFQEAFERVVHAVVDIFQTAMPIILPIVQGVIATVTTVIETIVQVIKDVVLFVTNIINGDFGKAFGNLADIVKTVVGNALKIIVELGPKLLEALGKIAVLAGQGALGLGKAIIEGIGKGLAAAAGFAGDVASGVLKAIKNVINRDVIDKINSGIPDSLGAGPFKINLPKNPIPHLAAGALVSARPGGLLANIAEGGRDEGVIPLPPGLVKGLQAIANGNFASGPAPIIGGDLVIQGATFEGANQTAVAAVRELRGEAFRQGK